MKLYQQNLFGGEEEAKPKPFVHGQFFLFKKKNRYRYATDENNCAGCRHSHMVPTGGRRVRKCRLMGESSSVASDVSIRMVCNLFRRVE